MTLYNSTDFLLNKSDYHVNVNKNDPEAKTFGL